MGNSDAATHLVQIVNKPDQCVTVEVWDPFLILLPIKYTAESLVKAW